MTYRRWQTILLNMDGNSPRSPSASAESANDVTQRPRHWARESFIPVRRAELAGILAAQEGISAEDQKGFRQLCQLLESTFHYEFHARLEDLKNAYAPFDPDADTEAIEPLAPAARAAQSTTLFEKLIWLLERANYMRLSRHEIELAVGAMSDWGLRLSVDFSVFDRLEVFVRGDIVGRRTRRRWRNLRREEEVEVPIYRRLVIVFYLRPHKRLGRDVPLETVSIKLFKNIPKMDVDMLLPGTRFKMSLFDQSKIFFPTLSGVAITAWKIFQGALVVAFTGVYGILAFVGLVAATMGYALRSFFGYLRTQQSYQLNLTRNLYYQNLDNNAGVLFRLVDEAEEQECREAILAWYVLWRNAGTTGWTQDQLDRGVETLVRETLDVEINFEIGDALQKVERLGLVESAGDGRLRAVPIPIALTLLDQAWDNVFAASKST